MERQYMIKRTDSDIMHYGVKGMKWGVRRYQKSSNEKRSSKKNNDNTRQRNKKIIIGSIAAASALTVIGGIALYKYKTSSYKTSINMNSLKLGKYAVDKLNLDDMVIPKGDVMFRSSNQQTLRDGPIFMSTNKKDRDRYIHRMGNMYKTLYQMKIKSTKDLKIPSEKKQFDMFVDLLTHNEAFSRNVTHNPYGTSENVFGNREAAAKFAKNYHYENFIRKMIDYDPVKKDVLSTFANYLKDKGYDGLVDVNDIRTTADKPIIALNKEDLIIDSIKKVNAGMKFISGLKLQNVNLGKL